MMAFKNQSMCQATWSDLLVDLQRIAGVRQNVGIRCHCRSIAVAGSQQGREANNKQSERLHSCVYVFRDLVGHLRTTCDYMYVLRLYMQQLTPHDPTFFAKVPGTTKVATSIFSASKDNASSPVANILHRTPFPVAWCP